MTTIGDPGDARAVPGTEQDATVSGHGVVVQAGRDATVVVGRPARARIVDGFPDVFGDLRGVRVTDRPWLRARVERFLTACA